jgi:non-ribosomal peptide synthetase component F
MEQGVRPDTVVGIALPRSAALVVAVLAVLKAGGAYVALDPDEPAARLAHVLADAAVPVVVSLHGIVDGAPWLQNGRTATVCLDDPATASLLEAHSAATPLVPGLSGENLAYLIYTSGTTGMPKAVLQRHRTLAQLMAAQTRPDAGAPVLLEPMPTLQFAALAFDVSIQEMATAWRTGSALVVVSKTDRMDPRRLMALIAARRIGRLFLPPAMLHHLAEAALAHDAAQFDSVREIVVAGDAMRLSPAVEALVQRHDIVLLNHYGPSETHVVTHHRIACACDGPLPPIGRPWPGTGR